jgi:hypothetical protein
VGNATRSSQDPSWWVLGKGVQHLAYTSVHLHIYIPDAQLPEQDRWWVRELGLESTVESCSRATTPTSKTLAWHRYTAKSHGTITLRGPGVAGLARYRFLRDSVQAGLVLLVSVSHKPLIWNVTGRNSHPTQPNPTPHCHTFR